MTGRCAPPTIHPKFPKKTSWPGGISNPNWCAFEKFPRFQIRLVLQNKLSPMDPNLIAPNRLNTLKFKIKSNQQKPTKIHAF
jgi:hypothetical protein